MIELLGLDAVSSPHNLPVLRRLHDQVELHVHGLKSLGVTADSYGSLLLPVLMKRLPQELRLIISRKTSDDEWKMDTPMKILKEELKARERTIPNTRDSGGRHGRGQPIYDILTHGQWYWQCGMLLL